MTNIEQLAVHFILEGNMIHIDSDEAKRQLAQSTSHIEGLLVVIIILCINKLMILHVHVGIKGILL